MDLIILIVAAFITSSISAVLGMGGGIILLAIMALIIPEGYVVVALHGIVQIISNLTRSFVFRHNIRRDIVGQYIPGAILGLILSAFIILLTMLLFQVESAKEIKIDFLKPLIGIFIIWWLFGKQHPIKVKETHFFCAGILSGVCTVFIGATGPLIAPFFIQNRLNKETIIANKAVCQTISHIGKIPLFILFFEYNYFSEINVLMPLIIAVFIGANMGKKILQFIPENIFIFLFKSVLTIIAFKLILEQLF